MKRTATQQQEIATLNPKPGSAPPVAARNSSMGAVAGLISKTVRRARGAREVDLRGQRLPIDDRGGGGRDRRAEERPGKDAGEDEGGIARSRVDLDDPREHDGEDARLQQRQAHSPQEAKRLTPVSDEEV